MQNYLPNARKELIFDVGIYVRLSREDDGRGSGNSESILNQKEFLIKYVADKCWNLMDIYCDDGYSGTNFDRPGFNKLLTDIENGKINAVITKDMSRLGRDYIDTGYYIEKFFPIKNVRYIAVNDGVDTFENSSNNDISPFKSVLNDMYAKDISQKVKTSVNMKRLKGEFIGSFAPFGYKKSEHDKHLLVIDPDISPYIVKIFDMYTVGNSMAEIANWLIANHVPTPTQYKFANKKLEGKLWNPVTIKCILKNSNYTGDLSQNKIAKVSYKINAFRVIPRDEWITVEGTHQAIITKEQFEMVQEMLQSRIVFSNTGCREHILSGLLYCGDCGDKMSFSNSHNRVYAICNKYRRHSKLKLCTRHSVLEQELEEIVVDHLRSMAEKYVHKDEILSKIQKVQENPTKKLLNQGKKVLQSLEEIRNIIKNLYQDKVRGIITEQDFIDLSDEFRKKREELVNQSEDIQAKMERVQAMQDNEDGYTQMLQEFLSFNEVNKPMLARLIEKIEVFENKKVTIHYRFMNPVMEY